MPQDIETEVQLTEEQLHAAMTLTYVTGKIVATCHYETSYFWPRTRRTDLKHKIREMDRLYREVEDNVLPIIEPLRRRSKVIDKGISIFLELYQRNAEGTAGV